MPFTNTVPKAMTPINGTPLLEYQLHWMRTQGVTDVVFLTGYLGETIREHFGDGTGFGVRVHYSHEDEPRGRGGAVRSGLQLVPPGENPVLVMNGDVVTDQDLSQLLNIHHARNAAATLMLTRHPSQFGIVQMGADDMVETFSEKGALPLWINAGVYVFNRELVDLLPEMGDHETETFPRLAAENRLAAIKSDAMWLTIDDAKDFRNASEKLATWAPSRESFVPED